MKANWTIRTPHARGEDSQDLLWLEWPNRVLGSRETVLGL